MKKLLVILFVLALPVFVFAQDGSAGSIPAPADNQAQATTSQVAPSAGTADPRPTPTPPTPNTSEGTAPTPVQITLPPVNMQIQVPGSDKQETDLSLLEILTIAAASLLGGLGIYKLLTKNTVENKSDDRKKNRCFNIKKMMEDKLKELTDLRGQLESKAKGMAREKIKEAIAGTETAKLFDVIEKAEKEYNRLKKLFEQCELELDAEKIKSLKFDESLVDLILTGKRDSTLRLLDDKNLTKGDELLLINKQSKETFGRAVITEIEEKKVSSVSQADIKEHELEKYYGTKLEKNSPLKIVHFKLKK